LKPDQIDARILQALMEDGRASLREVAQRTSLTTPTVSARFARMQKAGLIRKFVPVLSPESVNRGVCALITLKLEATSPEKVAHDLAKLAEAEHVYTTTGESITLKVGLENVRDLVPFLRQHVLQRGGVTVSSSQIITNVVKEEPPSLVPTALTMDLACDYCQGEVTSSRPYTISVGSSHYYFCCKTCKRDYLEKHGSKLAKLRRAKP